MTSELLRAAGDQVRSTWAALDEWMRQSTLTPSRITAPSTIAVLLCTSYQTLVIAHLLFAGRPSDGPAYAISQDWYGATLIVVVALGAAVLLIWRQRWPLAILLIVCGLYAAASTVQMNNYLFFPLLFALYTCVSHPRGKQVLAGVALTWAVVTLSAALVSAPGAFLAEYLGQLVTALAVIALAVAARSVRGWRLSQHHALEQEERVRTLDAERDRAVSRARVAAELHDSVGHGLTTIIALAEGLVGATGDPRLDEALAGINAVARESLDDTRQAVRALTEAERDPGSSDTRIDVSSPGGDVSVGNEGSVSELHAWAEISAALNRVRSLGVTAVFTETGRRRADPYQADLCFAITREALTNAVRHSRDLTRIVVSWDHTYGGAVTVTVRNDNAPPASQPADTEPAVDASDETVGPTTPSADSPESLRPTGTGLPRLQHRVDAAGGTLTYGPAEDDGWIVKAIVPSTRTQPRTGASFSQPHVEAMPR